MHGLVAFYMHDLSGGGVERMRLSLIAELRSRGEHVCLIVGCAGGALTELVPPDLTVIDLNCQGMLPSILPLARTLRRLRPKFLVASLDHNNVTALMAGWCARVGTRVIICQHNALSAERQFGWKYRAIPWLYWLLKSRAHGVVAVSQGVADDLAATAGVARDRITVIYNPVIDAGFASRAMGPVPHSWFNDEIPVCVFAGRLTAQKDPETALKSIAQLAANLSVRLIVLGEGPLLAELQLQAKVLGIAKRVAFAGFQTNPLPWIAHAACLLSTSRYEGLGNVLIEALALGTPVVATDCPYGPSEILLGGTVGDLVPVGDAAALVQAIARILSREPDRSRLRARAAAFSATACADAHLALFSKILQNERKSYGFGLTYSLLRSDQIADHIMMAPPGPGPSLLVTPNIDHVRLLRRPDFRAAYQSAALVCPDGFPVLAYARLRGLALQARVTGCDIFSCLVRKPLSREKRILIVAEAKTTEHAVGTWAVQERRTRVRAITAPAGLCSDPHAQSALAHLIREEAPDILIMTLGAPVSEIFVDSHRDILPTCWALCLGQAVRAHLGLVRRAPPSWQNAGLEWLWRLLQEPKRLAGRYVRALAWFPVAVLVDLVRPQSKA